MAQQMISLDDISESILVIGRDDKFVGDDKTIAGPTSAQSEEFSMMIYDPSLDDSYPDKPDSERRQPRKPQRTPYRDDSQEIEVIRQYTFRTNSNSTFLGPNIERPPLRTRKVTRFRTRKPTSPNSRAPQFSPRYLPL